MAAKDLSPLKKILIVDDEENSRFILKEFLKEFDNLVIEEAKDGKEAVSFASIEDYSLILIDIKMPRLDGLRVIEALKIVEPGLKFIIISAYLTKENSDKAKNFEIEEKYMLEKPVDFKLLKTSIENILNIRLVNLRIVI
jgi:YesN/AraC family two-component response regulator